MTALPSTGNTGTPSRSPEGLADILERVLDKGIVIAGDVVVNVLDIELLTLKLRLLVASVDTAKQMGIDWWQDDPFLKRGRDGSALEQRLRRLEERAGLESGSNGGSGSEEEQHR